MKSIMLSRYDGTRFRGCRRNLRWELSLKYQI